MNLVAYGVDLASRWFQHVVGIFRTSWVSSLAQYSVVMNNSKWNFAWVFPNAIAAFTIFFYITGD